MIFWEKKNSFMFVLFVVWFVMYKMKVLCAVLVIFFIIVNVLSEKKLTCDSCIINKRKIGLTLIGINVICEVPFY